MYVLHVRVRYLPRPEQLHPENGPQDGQHKMRIESILNDVAGGRFPSCAFADEDLRNATITEEKEEPHA